jgi:hypothetical protein
VVGGARGVAAISSLWDERRVYFMVRRSAQGNGVPQSHLAAHSTVQCLIRIMDDGRLLLDTLLQCQSGGALVARLWLLITPM